MLHAEAAEDVNAQDGVAADCHGQFAVAATAGQKTQVRREPVDVRGARTPSSDEASQVQMPDWIRRNNAYLDNQNKAAL